MSSVSRSEGAVIQTAILRYDAKGFRLFKNTSGVLKNQQGTPVRFGLGNTSHAVNQTTKSSDYIGWRPLLITPDMVGGVVAQFVGIEMKAEGWTPAGPGDKARYAHEQAQRKFGAMVLADGGYWEFCSE